MGGMDPGARTIRDPEHRAIARKRDTLEIPDVFHHPSAAMCRATSNWACHKIIKNLK